MDLLCVGGSTYQNHVIRGPDGRTWPRHPDLDVSNPMGLEEAPSIEAKAPHVAKAPRLKRYVYTVQPDGSQKVGPGGGHGIVVLDMDKRFTFVKRITTPAIANVRHGMAGGDGMRGIAADATAGWLYYSWHQGKPGSGLDGAGCIDLKTDKVLWERTYEFTCARLQVSIDGKTLYMPRHWRDRKTKKLYTIDAATGKPGRVYDCGRCWPQHPLVVHPDGRRLFFPGACLDLVAGEILWTSGISGRGNCHIVGDRTCGRLYTGRHPEQATVATWILDAESGRTVARVPIDTKAHAGLKGGLTECIGFEPGGKHFWGEASGERYMLRYDNTGDIPKLETVVDEKDLEERHGYRGMGHAHGHAMVSAAGDYVWFSNGVVLEAATGRYVCQWTAEDGKRFQGEKFLEIDFLDGEVLWAGQDEGHGFVYESYPIERVRPLLPESSPARRARAQARKPRGAAEADR